MKPRDWTFRMLRTVSAADRSFDGNESGPTIEEFASAHQLPPRWVELRKACSQLAGRADFWYRADLRDAARTPAVEASDILYSWLKRRSQSARVEMPKARLEGVDGTIRNDNEFADHQREG